jgi:CheY-like chemotaxis protein
MGIARRCILVADDDDFTRRCLSELLTANGYQIVEARDGREALEALSRLAPDLILLDLMMPNLSGLEVLQRLGAHRPPPPVIVISSMDTPNLTAQALRTGACRFVTKPFHPAEIVDEVAAALDPAA